VIEARDTSFHEPTSEPTPGRPWGETNYFGFYIPEIPLNGGVYALFRPEIGVVLSTVNLNTGRVETPQDADYWDSQVHLPIPRGTDLADFRLDNGLSIRAVDAPLSYQVDYDDGEGTEVHFDFTGLMPPFDIHDPQMDPMVAAQAEAGRWAWGTAYNGHFDQTGHARGEVVLRGRRYRLDCVTTMDHSWGPRGERHAHTMSWLHAHFSPQLAMHAIFDFDAATNGSDLSLTHGYVLQDGQVHGLKAGTGRVRRRGHYADEVTLRLVDRRDRVWELQGRGMTAFPWNAWPNVVGYNVLARWECEGRTGHGEIQDFFGVQTLCELAHPAAPGAVEALR
jgi:hypothetical protein